MDMKIVIEGITGLSPEEIAKIVSEGNGIQVSHAWNKVNLIIADEELKRAILRIVEETLGPLPSQ
jgi:hypothetical protein